MNLIIDGSNLLHRAYWINSKQSIQYGELFIFLRTLKSYIEKFKALKCYVCMDKKLLYPSTNFRTELKSVEYKANRTDSEDIYKNEDILSSMLSCLGIKVMFPRILEADDVMAWLSTIIQDKKMIISNDGDLLQMVSEDTIYFHPIKKTIIDLDNFESIIGVPHKYYLTYKAIMGDTSDNIKGCKGFGPVKAKKAAIEIMDEPEKLLNYPDDFKTILDTNKKLMDLNYGIHFYGDEEIDSYKEQFLQNPVKNIDLFKLLCSEYKFDTFIKKIDEWDNLFNDEMLLF